MSNFVSYENAQSLMAGIAAKFANLNGAYVVKGNSTFANLPATPTEAQAGFVYNVTDAFTTDARFVEGAGKKYSAGTNVVIVDNSTYAAVTPAGSENPSTEGWYELKDGKYVLSTDTTVDAGKTYYAKTVLVQYDVISTFVDVDGIEHDIADVAAMIAPKFNAANAYAIGDFVTKDNVLYLFKAAHTAGDPWDATEVDQTTVGALINGLLDMFAAIRADLAPVFDAANAYAIGDVVIKDNSLYKFKAAHTAGDPWSASEVDAVRVSDLISAEATSRTTADTAILADIADAFDAANAYAIGDIVTKDNGLYKFKAAHTAGDPWSASEVDAVQVADLIEAAEPDELTTAQVTALINLLD